MTRKSRRKGKKHYRIDRSRTSALPAGPGIYLDKTRASLYNSKLTAPRDKKNGNQNQRHTSGGADLELDQKLDLFDQGTASTAFRAVLHIKPMGNGTLSISGRVRSASLLECSRCLKKFPYPIDSELNIDLSPVSAMETAAPEHELAGDELEIEFYQGDEIEPLDYHQGTAAHLHPDGSGAQPRL